MLLFPRLPQTVARELAEELSLLSVEELKERCALLHPAAIYAPTGGSRVTTLKLGDIRTKILKAATEAGYPDDLNLASRRTFDSASAGILWEQMDISAAEGSNQGVWAFLACILLPDIVRWRFWNDDGTTNERFLGGNRGIRNTFGRVWWRADTLRLPGENDPYRLLQMMGEDELVQIMERPNLAGSRNLARHIALAFLDALPDIRGEISRSELLRDAMKRIRRLQPLLAFDAMDPDALSDLLRGIFQDSIRSLS